MEIIKYRILHHIALNKTWKAQYIRLNIPYFTLDKYVKYLILQNIYYF